MEGFSPEDVGIRNGTTGPGTGIADHVVFKILCLCFDSFRGMFFGIADYVVFKILCLFFDRFVEYSNLPRGKTLY
jgi:hypothetical protein